nr:hypothetical protein [Tanacetum cinerariifolium]
LKLSALKSSTKHNLDSSSCDLHHLVLLVTLDLHAHTFIFEYIRVEKVLICRIIMENLPPPNGNQNAPEEEPFMDQAAVDIDGFTPHWLGEHFSNINNGWIEGPSTAPIEGPSFPLPIPGLHVPPTVIEDLGTRLGNLEYKHRVVRRKMEEVSDAVVADSIAIREIHPRVAAVGEQVQVVEAQTTQVVNRLEEIETRVQQVESRVDTQSSGQMAVQGHDVIVGPNEQVQTLQTALHKTELQNQQLRTRVAELESHMGIVIPYMLWMEERLTVLEKRLPGPLLGPQ